MADNRTTRIAGTPLSHAFRLWAWAILLVSALLPASGVRAAQTIRVYPAPTGEPISSQFTVNVNRQNAPVYLAQVLAMNTEERLHHDLTHFTPGQLAESSFVSFDMRGAAATVTVTCPDAVKAAKILPTSRGIVPKVSGRQITFKVTKPGPLVLEVNGDWVRSLQVFANPWDKDASNPNDPNVIYFGPGIHKISAMTVASGKTVYIAGGAFVYGLHSPGGEVFELKGDNITLRGRGVIDGSLRAKGTPGLINAEGNNIHIEGVVLRDSSGWTVPITGADHVDVKNVKMIGYRGNSDGIDVNDSRNVSVEGCYIRTADDLVAIKTKIPAKGETRNVTVTGCVLWNEIAHALTVGQEIIKPVDNIVFSDCDVIRDKGREYLLQVQQADAGLIRGVTYQNIRIEECRWLISLWIGKTMFGHDPERGHIEDVTFRNIASTVPERAPVPYHPNSEVDLKGYDAAHAIHGVTLDHITIGGKPLQASQVLQEAFVYGVTVTP